MPNGIFRRGFRTAKKTDTPIRAQISSSSVSTLAVSSNWSVRTVISMVKLSAVALAYLAPPVLDRLLIQRAAPAMSLKELIAASELPWCEQEEAVFGAE